MKKSLIASSLLFLFSLLIAAESKVSITIYNNNLALVRDVRPLEFKKGMQEFKFEEVAAQIDPTSVHFKTPGQDGPATILEQNFEFDLVGKQRLLEKYIDQDVEVALKEGQVVLGKLMSAQDGDLILQTSDGKITVLSSSATERINFPNLPDGLITKPTLVWLINSSNNGRYNSEISYLTHGINWHAEYVAVANDDDTGLELSGWVSIDNRSGADYENAKLKLVAGDVNIVKERPKFIDRAMAASVSAYDDSRGFEEKSFFEYHLYTLGRPATVKDRQIKQLSLFDPVDTAVKKIYTFNGQQDHKVRVNLEFKNDEKSGMGMPLPKGKIRVYKEDSDGSQEFIGEDQIDHTPKDEKVRLFLGNAFDIVGERILVRDDKVTKSSRKQTISVELRNRKDEDISVLVVENFWGDTKLVGDTPPIFKQDARKVEFKVDVAKNSEKTVEYTFIQNY